MSSTLQPARTPHSWCMRVCAEGDTVGDRRVILYAFSAIWASFFTYICVALLATVLLSAQKTHQIRFEFVLEFYLLIKICVGDDMVALADWTNNKQLFISIGQLFRAKSIYIIGTILSWWWSSLWAVQCKIAAWVGGPGCCCSVAESISHFHPAAALQSWAVND